jgi:hypothetical protein
MFSGEADFAVFPKEAGTLGANGANCSAFKLGALHGPPESLSPLYLN